jgi:hypothetical protein
MTQADSVHSTPPTNTPIFQSNPVDATSRRRFLTNAAGVAAGGAVLALATIPPVSAAAAPMGLPDPVFGLIEAHRTASAANSVALAEQAQRDLIADGTDDSVADAQCDAEMNAFIDLIQTAPTTFVGLQAWAAYLDEIRIVEGWMFEEAAQTLVVTLVEALGNLAVPA